MRICVDAGGSITGEHGVGPGEARLHALDLHRGRHRDDVAPQAGLRRRRAFNPCKAFPTSKGCGEVHSTRRPGVRRGRLRLTAVSGASKLEQQLRRTRPPDCVRRGAAAFAVDGIEPGAVVSPDSPEAVAAVLADAAEGRRRRHPLGRRLAHGLGMPPERYDLALDLSAPRRRHRVRARRPDRDRRGRHPPRQPAERLGRAGTVAAARPARAAGRDDRRRARGQRQRAGAHRLRQRPRPRHRHDSSPPRTADLVKAGGRVVKNVAGYDLAQAAHRRPGHPGRDHAGYVQDRAAAQAARTLSICRGTGPPWSASPSPCATPACRATGIAIVTPLGAAEARLLLRFAGSSAAVDRSCLDAAEAGRAAAA